MYYNIIPDEVQKMGNLSRFVKERRKLLGITQVELAEKAGVGLRFVRELEQGKESVRLDKVNEVLALFSHEVGAVTKTWETEE